MSSMAASTDSAFGLPPAPTVALPEVPAPGRIVTVRGSTWAVVDVRRQGLPRSPADEATAGLDPMVRNLERRGMRRGSAVSLVVVVIVAGLALLATAFAWAERRLAQAKAKASAARCSAMRHCACWPPPTASASEECWCTRSRMKRRRSTSGSGWTCHRWSR